MPNVNALIATMRMYMGATSTEQRLRHSLKIHKRLLHARFQDPLAIASQISNHEPVKFLNEVVIICRNVNIQSGNR